MGRTIGVETVTKCPYRTTLTLDGMWKCNNKNNPYGECLYTPNKTLRKCKYPKEEFVVDDKSESK